MWPSDNAIKRTLSGTNELLFNTAGCLKLNNAVHLPEYLNKELIESAVHLLNTAFEQKEKLILANQLRNYINSSHYQELLKSKKLSFWKNLIKSLPFLYIFYASSSIVILIILLSVPYTWPMIVVGLPITGLLAPLSLWLMQRIPYRLAQTAKIKNVNKLITLIDTINQTEHPVNPLFITRESKLFEECAPQKLPNFPSLNTDHLAQKLALITKTPSLYKALMRHISSESNYQQKDNLKQALELIYYRLEGKFDTKLGPLPEKAVLIAKLVEGLTACSPGFHNRVNTILSSFQQPQNLSELLYWVRKSLVEKATMILTNEIHAANDFSIIAHLDGLGTQPNFTEDIYNGVLTKDIIRFALQAEFENSYTLFNLPVLLVDSLRGILLEMDYTGAKEKTESYTIGCADCETDKFTESIKKYLPNPYFQNLDWANFFIIDEENYHILDLNWKLIKQYFLDCLLKENYFVIPSFNEFSKNLVSFLAYKNKQDFNYLMLLAKYQPESLKLLFYYLKIYPRNETEKIKEQLIDLFFKKNRSGQNTVQIAAQYQPKSLKVLLNFIDKHIDKFDLEINDFFRIEKYHVDSLKILFDFTEKHLTLADKQTIATFFLEKNDAYWNTFVRTTHNQPKTALTILNYIIKHREMFNAKASSGQSLFKENLKKIQQGLSNLLAIKKPDNERTHILLKFISLYPELLVRTPKKVAHFIFSSIATINDKKLIDNVFESYSSLLLNYFSINYFARHTKNTEYILGKLLCAYHAELISRTRHNIIYTNFFKWGVPVHKKLNALESVFTLLKKNHDFEKGELNSLKKTNYKVLTNGRLGQLFKLCCNNDTLTEQIKIELPQSKPIHSFNTL